MENGDVSKRRCRKKTCRKAIPNIACPMNQPCSLTGGGQGGAWLIDEFAAGEKGARLGQLSLINYCADAEQQLMIARGDASFMRICKMCCQSKTESHSNLG